MPCIIKSIKYSPVLKKKYQGIVLSRPNCYARYCTERGSYSRFFRQCTCAPEPTSPPQNIIKPRTKCSDKNTDTQMHTYYRATELYDECNIIDCVCVSLYVSSVWLCVRLLCLYSSSTVQYRTKIVYVVVQSNSVIPFNDFQNIK